MHSIFIVVYNTHYVTVGLLENDSFSFVVTTQVKVVAVGLGLKNYYQQQTSYRFKPLSQPLRLKVLTAGVETIANRGIVCQLMTSLSSL